MSTVFEERTFVSRAGNVLGKALIPADWSASGGIDENWQGEMVPFVATMNAGSPDGGIYMRTSSKDVHTDLRCEVDGVHHDILCLATLVALTSVTAVSHLVVFGGLDIFDGNIFTVNAGE